MHVTCCQSNSTGVDVLGAFPLPHTFAQLLNRNRGIQYVSNGVLSTPVHYYFDVANIQTVFHISKFIYGVAFHDITVFNNGIPRSFAPVKIPLCTRIRHVVCRVVFSRIWVTQSSPTRLSPVPTVRLPSPRTIVIRFVSGV